MRNHPALGPSFLALYGADIPRSDHSPHELRQLATVDPDTRRALRVEALACRLAGEPAPLDDLEAAHGWAEGSAKRHLRRWESRYGALGLRAIMGPWLRSLTAAERKRWLKRWNL